MKIKVEVRNEILGDSIFWEGDSTKLAEIQNLPAKRLADMVVIDGLPRRSGMWYVTSDERQMLPCPFCGAAGLVDSDRPHDILFYTLGCANKDCRESIMHQPAAFPSTLLEIEIGRWNHRA